MLPLLFLIHTTVQFVQALAIPTIGCAVGDGLGWNTGKGGRRMITIGRGRGLEREFVTIWCDRIALVGVLVVVQHYRAIWKGILANGRTRPTPPGI